MKTGCRGERTHQDAARNGVTGRSADVRSAILVNIINESGILPTNNFQTSQADYAEISGERMTENT